MCSLFLGFVYKFLLHLLYLVLYFLYLRLLSLNYFLKIIYNFRFFCLQLLSLIIYVSITCKHFLCVSFFGQIFVGRFPGTSKDIVPDDCEFFVKMCNLLEFFFFLNVHTVFIRFARKFYRYWFYTFGKSITKMIFFQFCLHLLSSLLLLFLA